MSLPEKRLAADGAAYTYAEFEQWYREHAGQMWEGAAATEHSQSRTPGLYLADCHFSNFGERLTTAVHPAQCIAADSLSLIHI